jgi:hypothetical protein
LVFAYDVIASFSPAVVLHDDTRNATAPATAQRTDMNMGWITATCPATASQTVHAAATIQRTNQGSKRRRAASP